MPWCLTWVNKKTRTKNRFVMCLFLFFCLRLFFGCQRQRRGHEQRRERPALLWRVLAGGEDQACCITLAQERYRENVVRGAVPTRLWESVRKRDGVGSGVGNRGLSFVADPRRCLRLGRWGRGRGGGVRLDDPNATRRCSCCQRGIMGLAGPVFSLGSIWCCHVRQG